MIDRIRAALDGMKTEPRDELVLQDQIAAAFDKAGLEYSREVRVGKDRIDFVVNGNIAIEVKAGGGTGLAPWRQLFRYLEDDRFDHGVLITVKATRQPTSHFERADGTLIPLHKIELWKNLL